MEFLKINLNLEYLKGNFTPIYKMNPMITHLLYADNILIMAKANIRNAESIMHIVQNMKCLIDLDVNENQSTVFLVKGLKMSNR